MDDIRLSLPAGYEIHTSYDTTEFIHDELNKIYLRTGVTVAILLLFVLLITFSPKYLFLIVTSLTVNMAIAVIFTMSSDWKCSYILWRVSRFH